MYFTYTNPTDKQLCGYEMLIGYITDDKFKNDNPKLKTITIPAQDYQYVVTKTCTPPEIQAAWENVNSLPYDQVSRAYGYDLEMYAEDFSNVTIAVSVNKTK